MVLGVVDNLGSGWVVFFLSVKKNLDHSLRKLSKVVNLWNVSLFCCIVDPLSC